MKSNNGSALIMVLWSLVLISFLAGHYLEHNRGKACLAGNAWDSFKQKEAIDSVLHLFSIDSWPIPEENDRFGSWATFSPNDADLWVKVDSESSRININTAPESKIRNKVMEVLEETHVDEADRLTDAILDWRDTDILVRTNGAEAGFYDSLGLGYNPANGPFKVLTELLLVRGVTSERFWGDPMAEALIQEEEDAEKTTHSLLEAFTIYDKNTKRVSILAPGKRNSYTLITAFLEKKENRWCVLQIYRSMLTTPDKKTQFLDQTESVVEFS